MQLLYWFEKMRNPVLDFFFSAITYLGDEIALMLIAITLLTSSVLKLRGVQSITSFGSVFKIVGSYAWFSGAISSIFIIIAAFFVDRNILNAIPTILFFAMLATRSVIFAVKESRSYAEQLEQEEAEQTEV